MASLKSLARETAIYGLSSIVGRFLNYLLVPLYTFRISSASGGYGVITEIYAYVALLLVLLTFGMETTFFRFSNKEGEDARRVYSTTLLAVLGVGVCFLAVIFGFLDEIAAFLHYSDHPEYLGMMAACVAIDAFQSIPFAYLRLQKRALKFAALKLLFIFLNISLNLLYYVVLGKSDVFYAFAINLFCTALITVFFYPELRCVRWTLDWPLLRRMLRYAWPILILGIAGILNQTADKIIFPLVYGDAEAAKSELGIYGACVKIAMIMAMITQAFRYAYEPFVFGKAKDKNSGETYATVMKFFIIFTLLAYLCVIGYMDILKRIIAPDYWPGLRVVPIVMAAEIMMGVYFNLSFWYKLIDKTIWGAWFSAAGCLVLFAVNIIFIPTYSYMACAWGGFAGYATAMLLSYIVGQKKNPVRYPLKSIGIYVLIAGGFYAIMACTPEEWPVWTRLGINTVLILLFVGHILKHDLPVRSLPVIGKYFHKFQK